jgi:hypothetical protein
MSKVTGSVAVGSLLAGLMLGGSLTGASVSAPPPRAAAVDTIYFDGQLAMGGKVTSGQVSSLRGGRAWFNTYYFWEVVESVDSAGTVYARSEVQGAAADLTHAPMTNRRTRCYWDSFNSTSYPPLLGVCKYRT